MPPRVRSTANVRRADVMQAAIDAFARTGYHGTSTKTIAAGAGISEGYVFRLFGTKQALFITVLHDCFEQIIGALTATTLDGMADQYAQLITSRELMMIQIQALAACDDESVRHELQAAQGRLVEHVKQQSGASDDDVQQFFARGQLCHFVVALGVLHDESGWARTLTKGIRHY
ncbi:TetR/AcrR family transcriptional regulator [Paractinoplanes lichenicola]|uniref:TetR/AcrR family transcriptional regulator n=1 Tax=Paractinoplanes lichenicola TaxID=2802976 RepID=A0ABS1VVU1_9ACTN|nr:TetR/AcrR family transcriptional regulator [Actinoplanes lichenicola]MBL7258602.1 TetR/AcrR family transcriptional regulator [Actinoplanes lichenicola]